jgi:hypothetical protein
MSIQRKMRVEAKKPPKKQTFSEEHRFWFYQDIPFFSINHPSINEAAELIVIDRFFSGYYPQKKPKNFDGDPKDPRLLKALEKEIEIFNDRLVSAVERGLLKADPLKRDLDDNLIPGVCHIRSSDIIDWLSKRGYQVGDIFREYSKNEFKVLESVCNEIFYMRTFENSDNGFKGFNLIQSIEKDSKLKDPKIKELIRLYKSAIAENEKLGAKKMYREPPIVDAPIPTRTKRTMLTIIAALCALAKIKYQERGAAQRIKEGAERLGAPIDDETIINILKQIDDALDSRMK